MPADRFARLVALARSNEELLRTLRSLQVLRLEAFRAAERGVKPEIVRDSYARTQEKIHAVRCLLRSNRIEAAALLGTEVAPEPEVEPWPALAN